MSPIATADILTLDDTCTISILNRSVQASSDGTWLLDNVPSFLGQVRARATCVRDGLTVSGQTNFFTVQQNRSITVGAFNTVDEQQTPVSLDFATGNNTVLVGAQTYFRLRVFANYADGRRQDVTRFASGINYTLSNPAIAQIDANGVMQAISSGRVLVTARQDGTSATLSVTVVTTGDSDEDGLPDDFEVANNLNPNDAIDAAEDVDGDGLTALQEFLAGTDLNNTDTDGDTISDGEEASAGADGFITNPLLIDSDSDGISDNLEIAVGTDPSDIASVNFGASIAGIDLNPDSVVLTFNSIQGADASVQLNVSGTTLDGATIDLTAASKGTNYNSSDLQVCNFGGAAGEVFAGNTGDCVVTADNTGFTDSSAIAVESFDPQALNLLARDDNPQAIALLARFAYIGTNTGLQVVDVSNPLAPVNTAFLDLGTSVADVQVQGQYVYLATANAGLVIVDVSDAGAPVAVAALLPGIASVNLALSQNIVYIAGQNNGLFVVDASQVLVPRLVNILPATGSIRAVAVTQNGIAVLDSARLRLLRDLGSGLFSEQGGINFSNPRNLQVDDNTVFVADSSATLRLVDISDADSPVIIATLPFNTTGRPNDLMLAGKFAFLADTSFANGVPIVDISDVNAPAARGLIDFTDLGLTGATGHDVAVDNQYVYVVTGLGLQIGQYQQFIDANGIAPTVAITTPAFADSALEGGSINVLVDASDDVAVAEVQFYLDGEFLFADIAPPYQFLMPLPLAQSTTEISVQAVDYGNNQSTLSSISINLLADSDRDGLSDDDETTVHGTSPFAADTDADGLSDTTEINLGFNALDKDIDNDELLDGEELLAGADGFVTNPFDPDSDNDTIPDGFESRFGLNPLDPSDANLDLDGDGFSNVEEFRLGFDPTTADSDQDGMPDEYERRFGLNPLNPEDFFGDIDDDGVPNGVEFNEGTDPTNPDVTAPIIVAGIPAQDAALPVNASVLIRFNEPILALSVNEVVLTMRLADDADVLVAGELGLSSDGFNLVFNPSLTLPINTQYNISVSGARDLAGNPMAFDFTLTLLTGLAPDNVAPLQLRTSLIDNARDVAVNSLINIEFDQVIDPSSLNDSNFFLFDTLLRQHVAGGIGVSADGRQLFFMPTDSLLAGRSYYLQVGVIKDLAGNACSNCPSSQRIDFTTGFDNDNLPPEVLTSTVIDGATNVPTNARFVINFDETIGLLLMDDIALVNNGLATTFAFSQSSDRRQLVVTVPSLLLANASYQLTLSGVKDVSGNITGNLVWQFTTGPSADANEGNIVAWSFANAATEVALNPLLEIVLSEAVDPASVNMSSFYLRDTTANRIVPGNWTLTDNGRVLRFIPDALLIARHRYYLHVGSSFHLVDLAGNQVARSKSRYFDTGDVVDITAPSIALMSVPNNSDVVPINSRFLVELNEPIGDSCLPQAQLTSAAGNIDLLMVIGSDRRSVSLSLPFALVSQTAYNLSLINLCDYSGNVFNAPDVLSFTTIDTDNIAPRLLSASPLDGDVDVAVTSQLVLKFSEAIAQTTRLRILGPNSDVAGSYEVQADTLTFTPSSPLQGDAEYVIYIEGRVTDLVGNGEFLGYSYFTTAPTVDTTKPVLSDISPTADAVNIDPNGLIRLTFSKPMRTATVNSTNIRLYVDQKAIRPGVTRSVDGQQVTLSTALPAFSVVSVILTDGLEDLSGNSLDPVVSSFTTGVVDRDSSSPRVVKQLPSNGSRDLVNVNQLTLIMDEAMDPQTLQQGLHVTADGIVVDGVIELLSDQQTIRFTAEQFFAENTYVQVFLDELATDKAGNPAFSYSGYFELAGSDERVGERAQPEAFSPFNRQFDVPLNPLIMVQFNEPIDPAGLNSAYIDLQVDDGNVSVPVQVNLDATGFILQIRPSSNLIPGTAYQIYIDDIIDTDGDTNTSRYSSQFTTAVNAVVDDRQPVVIAVSPPNGAIEVGINANYASRYDEVVNPISLVNDLGQLINVQFSETNQVLRYERQGTLDSLTDITEFVPIILDLAGNTVVPSNGTFTTAAGPDFIAPTVTGSLDSVTGSVATNPILAWQFSEPIDPVSVNNSSVYLVDSSTNKVVPSQTILSANGLRVDLVPEQALAVARSYRYHAFGLRDLSGNNLANNSRSFTTGFVADELPPQFLDATISAGQNGVPTNVRFNFRFAEPLSRQQTSAVSLAQTGGDAVAISTEVVNSASPRGAELQVVPKQLLAANTEYTLILSDLEDISGNVIVTTREFTFTTAASPDLISGQLLSISLPQSALNVALNPLLEVRFDEPIDPTSIDADSFYLLNLNRDKRVAGSAQLSDDGTVLRFITESVLELDSRYRFHAGRFNDLAGNEIASIVRTFDTSIGVDESAPEITLASIANNSVGVPINSRLVLELSETLSTGCSPEALLSSSAGDVLLSLTINNAGTVVTLNSIGALAANTAYSLSLRNFCDFSGNSLNANELLSFTTGLDEPDFIAPNLVAISPSANAMEVPVTSDIIVEFDEAIDQNSRPRLYSGNIEVLGSSRVDGNTLTFTPNAPLQGGMNYTIELTNFISDFAGNNTYLGFYSFTTENFQDTTSPNLVLISPEAGTIDINPGVEVQLMFSEPMAVNSVNSSNIVIYANQTIVSTSVLRSPDGQRVIVTPFNMPPDTIVSVVLTDGLQDLSGNPLTPVVKSFTTGKPQRDSTRPFVIRQYPSNGATELSDVRDLVLVMAEPMQASTIASALNIVSDGVLLEGVVELLSDDQTIRFTPTLPFAPGSKVQVFLDSTATDTAGNSAFAHSAYFSIDDDDEAVGTRAFPEVFSPFNRQTKVPLNPLIMVRYNEPLDPNELANATIDLREDANNLSVPVSVSLDSSGHILRVIPQLLLNADTVYQLRLDTIVDNDGDINTSLYTRKFTTGAQVLSDNRPPVVLAISPPNGAVEVGLTGSYAIKYDEPMNPISFDDDSGQRVDVMFSEDNQVLRYSRQGSLEPVSEVTEVAPAIVDLAGNSVIATSSTFTTVAAPNFIPPQVIGSVTGTVATNPVIAFQFSAPIDPVSVSRSGVYLRDNLTGVLVPSTIGLSADGRSLQLVPLTALAVGRDYRYYSSALRDLSGNVIPVRFFNFTTSFEIDETAPVIFATTVAEGQVQVPINAPLRVRVNEPLRQNLVPSLSLTDVNGSVVPATVSYSADRKVISLVPLQLLSSNTAYRFNIADLEDISGNILASPGLINFSTGPTIDIKPGVASQSIPNSATDIALNPLLEITFSERIDPTSISDDNVSLRNTTRNQFLPGTWQLINDGSVLRFTPDDVLELDSRYQFSTGSFYDLAGNLVSGRSFFFSTSFGVDLVAPLVDVVSISDASVAVPVNSKITIELNEPLSDGCQPSAQLSSPAGNIGLVISLAENRRSLTLTAKTDLVPSTAYALVLSNFCDFSGNVLSDNQVVSFTTLDTPAEDVAGPRVVNVIPELSAADVSINANIVAVFDEPIANNSFLRLTGNGVEVLGNFSVDDNTLTFVPDAPLQGNVVYSIDLAFKIFDIAGNSHNNGSFSFTTEDVTDVTRPRLQAISPAADVVGVSPATNVQLIFSEPMAANSINADNIVLYINQEIRRPSVSRSADGQRVTLTSSIPASSVVSVVLSDNVKDLAGNKLIPAVSSFTTGAVNSDSTRPRVVRQYPSNGSVAVVDAKQLVIVLDEAMDRESIFPALHIAADGVLVAGATEVFSDNQTVRFTPEIPFAPGVEVQVFLESLAKDAAGNPVFDYSGVFRTAVVDEQIGTRAFPTLVSPYDRQTDVPLNPVIMVRYSEPLDPAALTNALVDLQFDASNQSLPVNVGLDSTRQILRVTPQSLLVPGIQYELRLDNIVDDDGDVNTSLYAFKFSTAFDAVDDDRQPTVVALSPPDGASEVGLSGRYSVQFDEPMNPITFDSDGGQRIDVMFSEDNRLVRYYRQGSLSPLEQVTEAVPAMTDLAENTVVTTTSSFTTAAAPDFFGAQVINSVSGLVANNPIIAWQFDDRIDPLSVTETGVYLRDQLTGVTVPTSIGLSSDGTRLDIVPNQALALGRSYRYYQLGLRDLSDNPISGASQTFTTNFSTDATGPTLLAATVVDNQTGVPVNVRLSVRFDEPLSALQTAGVRLIDSNGQLVAATISFNSDRRVITLVPNSLLSNQESYRFVVENLQDLSGSVQQSPLDVSFTTGNSADFSAGSLKSVSIPYLEKGIALNPLLLMRFSEPIDPSSITENSFALFDYSLNRRVAGEWVLLEDGSSLRFDPETLLEPYRLYNLSATFSDRLTDFAANKFPNVTAIFETGDKIDETIPQIVVSNVATGSENVPVNVALELELNEPISDSCTVQAVLQSAGVDLVLQVTLSTNRQRLKLSSAETLAANSEYNLLLSGVCDFSGNQINSFDVLGFTTGSDGQPDNVTPKLLSVFPEQSATNVAPDTSIVLEFDEAISQSSRIDVTGDGVTVFGETIVSGSTLTFTPATQLQGGVIHTVGIDFRVSDLAGNSGFYGNSAFTVEKADDVAAPTVIAISPTNKAIDIHPAVAVRLTFSEPMKANTVNNSNIILYANRTVIFPSLSVSADGQQVSLSVPKPQASVVSVILTDGLLDLSGNSMVPVISSFTTATVDTDTVRPRVVQQFPFNGSNNLFDVEQIVLVLDEAMDNSTIDDAFHVLKNGTLVAGSVELLSDDRSIRFIPDIPFEQGAYIQVFLESIATDTAGNFSFEYNGYFQLGETTEGVGSSPLPQLFSPYNGQFDIALNPVVMVRYNEPLDPLALATADIDLQVNLIDQSVPVAASLGDENYVLRITPQQPLLPGTNYELSLDNIVDNDGDINTSLYRSEFTTAIDAVVDDRRPVVLGISPPDGSIDIQPSSRYTIVYDEQMNPISFDDDNGQRVNVLFSEQNRQVQYDRQASLPPATQVTENAPAMTDISANLVVDKSSTFVTAATPDVIGPRLIESVVGTVPTNVVIAMQFNKPIDPQSVSTTGVSIIDANSGAAVDANAVVTEDGLRVILVPLQPLTAGVSYNYLGNSLRDLSGNLVTNFSTTITTSFLRDEQAIEIVSTTVASDQVEVPLNVRLNVGFSEPLSLLGEQTIRLLNGAGELQSVSRSLNADRTVLTITPKQLLAENTSYTLEVSGFEDIAGNSLLTPLQLSFTTGVKVDLLESDVVSWSIPNAAEDVALNPLLEVSFSEAIDPSTITTETFYFQDDTDNKRVNGVAQLSADGRVLRFVLDGLLTPNHRYQLSLSRFPYFTDLAGNFVARNRSRNFTTGFDIDETSPVLSVINMADGSIDVPINPQLVIAANEPVGDGCQALAILTSNSLDIILEVDTDAQRQTLTLTTIEHLAVNTSYQLSLSNFCDYSGNKFGANSVLSFTTSSALIEDGVGPNFVSILPGDNATGVPITTPVVVEFDEPVDIRFRPEVSANGVNIPGQFSTSANVVTFVPDQPLLNNVQYSIRLFSIRDLAGNSRSIGIFLFTTE